MIKRYSVILRASRFLLKKKNKQELVFKREKNRWESYFIFILLKSYFRFVLFLPILQTSLVNRQTCANESNDDETFYKGK